MDRPTRSSHHDLIAASPATPLAENPPSNACRRCRRSHAGIARQERTDMRSALALVVALGLAAPLQAETHRDHEPIGARPRRCNARVEKLLGHRDGSIGDLPATGAAHRSVGRDRLRRGTPRPAGRRRRVDALCRQERDAIAYVRVQLNARHNEPHAGGPARPRAAARRRSRRTPRSRQSPDELREFYRRLGCADRAGQLRLCRRTRSRLPGPRGARASTATCGWPRPATRSERRLLDGGSIDAPGMH